MKVSGIHEPAMKNIASSGAGGTPLIPRMFTRSRKDRRSPVSPDGSRHRYGGSSGEDADSAINRLPPKIGCNERGGGNADNQRKTLTRSDCSHRSTTPLG